MGDGIGARKAVVEVVEIDDVDSVKAECEIVTRVCVTVVVTTDIGIENAFLSVIGVEHSSPQERAGCSVAEDAEDDVDVEPCITICARDKIDFSTSRELFKRFFERVFSAGGERPIGIFYLYCFSLDQYLFKIYITKIYLIKKFNT